MSDINPTTEDIQPVVTGGDKPTATQPSGDPSATEDTVVLKKDDYNKLISQRDTANNTNRKNDDLLASVVARQERTEKIEFIDDFLESNKDKYPDLKREDLMSLTDPDDAEKLAAQMQRRIEDAVQDKLKNVQVATTPTISPEDRDKKLAALKKNPGKRGFGEMLRLRQQ